MEYYDKVEEGGNCTLSLGDFHKTGWLEDLELSETDWGGLNLSRKQLLRW